MAYLDDPFGFAYMENKNTMAYLDDSSFGNAYMDNKPAYHADLPDNAHVDKKEINDTNASYSYNKDAAYSVGGKWKIKNSGTIFTSPKIYIDVRNSTAFFYTQYKNIFDKYKLPRVDMSTMIIDWKTTPMQFWQNQLNFAVWCSTSGCGVAYDDHIMTSDVFTQSLYRFHVYYTIRRILKRMKAALPWEQSWDPLNNAFDRKGYEEVCNEFNIDPKNTEKWRLPRDYYGLGPVEIAHVTEHYVKYEIRYIAQTDECDYTNFILSESKGFTRAGVEYINDSIRTYVWAILSAQTQTRTNILGTGTAFDAQNQYVSNLEDAIQSPVDIPSSIDRYEDTLKYASSKVDFVYGIGLYMAPSDMSLHIGTVAGYNNEIVIADDALTLGVNDDLNVDRPPMFTDDFDAIVPKPPPDTDPVDFIDTTSTEIVSGKNKTHEEEKTALILGGLVLGSLTIWFLRR